MKTLAAAAVTALLFACGGEDMEAAEDESFVLAAGGGSTTPAPAPCQNGILQYPDLVPISAEIVNTRTGPRLTVVIKNEGCGTSAAMRSAFEITHNTVRHVMTSGGEVTYVVPRILSWSPSSFSLAFGQSRTFSTGWSGSVPTEGSLRIAVDDLDTVDELNEANNVATYPL